MADDTPPSDDTLSMFPKDASESYVVLARRYRPLRFEDLIGQDVMVRTLTNAFETGRIAHAFMLTGVRGVGKTTTARLLARALNYTSDQRDAPSLSLDPPGDHCDAIMAGRHPDVLELDAASRTGVADMRDLLDGSRYSPVSARFKVYIIDEVHMLSTAAFNALLKTLEEPPSHVKFIFATTEIRKVPVTVLSRCQRFDLKRLEPTLLASHLGNIAAKENARVSEEALALIARAAEGSARDGVSLLDQAIVQAGKGEAVTGEAVRDMLGLADHGRLLDAFEKALGGEARAALDEISDQMLRGADPAVILKDFMEVAADISIAQTAGDTYIAPGPADWTARIKTLAAKLSPAQASRYWQLLLAGHRDLQIAPDPAVALKMIVLRLVAAASLPSPEDAARRLGGTTPPGKPQAKTDTPAQEGALASFDAILAAIAAKREVTLQVDLERFVRPSFCEEGTLSCALAPNAPADLLNRLKAFLDRESGVDWMVTLDSDGGETVSARAARQKAERFAAAAEHPLVAAALKSLPGAQIIEVSESGNVIDLDARRKA